MQAQNEIEFLLNFTFENAGAEQMSQYMQTFNKVFADLNALIAVSSPLLDKYTEQQNQLIEVTRKLSEATLLENQVGKDAQVIISEQFQKALQLTQALKEVNASKQSLIKTTEMFKGEQKAASDMVSNLSGKLLKLRESLNAAINEKDSNLVNKFTKAIGDTEKSLLTWNKTLVNVRVEMDGAAASNEKWGGIITQTKENIALLTQQLDEFTTVEQLASKEAQALKEQLASQNNILQQLNQQISGRLTLERALSTTLNANIKLENDILAIEERSIDLKAQSIIAEDKYKASVQDRVSVLVTGYTLQEEAQLKQMIQEEEAFDNSWRLGQQWLRQQEEIFDKAWRAGEEYQIKKTRLEKEAFDKAWMSAEDWLKHQELVYDKAWRAGEEYLLKQEQAFDKAWRDGENWQIKQAQAAEKAEAQKQAAIEKTTILYKLQQYVVRDLFRVVAAMLTIIPIMALISFIVEATKNLLGFGAAAEKAREDVEKFKVTFADAAFHIHEQMAIELEDIKILIDTSKDLNTSYENRVTSINKVREAYGELLDKYTDIEIAENKDAVKARKKADDLKEAAQVAKSEYQATLKDIEDNKVKIQQAIETKNLTRGSIWRTITAQMRGEDDRSENAAIRTYQSQINTDEGVLSTRKSAMERTDKEYRDFINPSNKELKISKFKAELKQIERINESTDYSKYGLTDKSTADDVRNMKNNNKQYQEDTNFQIQEIRRLKDTIAELEGRKDPKGAKGRKPRDIEEERATEKARNSGEVEAQKNYYSNKIVDVKTEFENSGQSDIDKVNMYIKLQNEAQFNASELERIASKHIENMEAINTKWEGKHEVSNEKMKLYRQEDLNNLNKSNDDAELSVKKTNEELAKESNDDLLRIQKYNEEKLKIIQETNKTMLKISLDAKRAVDEQALREKQDKRAQDKASRFNPITAFFGGGAGGTGQDWKDELKNFDDIQKKVNQDLEEAKTRVGLARTAFRNSSDKLTVNETVRDPSKLQQDEFAKDRSTNNSDAKELESANIELVSRQKIADENIKNKKLAQLEKEQSDKIKIAEATATAVDKIANAAFDAQQKRIQTQMQSIRNQYALENTLAGNNSAAKIRLAIAEAGKLKQLNRENFESQKAQGIFNAVINTAVGVTKALADPTVPTPVSIALATIVGAAGAFQIAAISKEQPPQYSKGRRGGAKEVALVGELGEELKETKEGKFSLLGSGLTQLEEGDTIHTHEKSMRMLGGSKDFLRDLIKGNKAYAREKSHTIVNSISKEDMKWAMSEAMKDMKAPVINLPAQGIESRLQRTQQRNGINN